MATRFRAAHGIEGARLAEPLAAIVLDLFQERGEHCPTKLQEDITMGDKSPKAKDKSRKQDTADKNQKALAAKAKMSPSPVFPGKKAK